MQAQFLINQMLIIKKKVTIGAIFVTKVMMLSLAHLTKFNLQTYLFTWKRKKRTILTKDYIGPIETSRQVKIINGNLVQKVCGQTKLLLITEGSCWNFSMFKFSCSPVEIDRTTESIDGSRIYAAVLIDILYSRRSLHASKQLPC